MPATKRRRVTASCVLDLGQKDSLVICPTCGMFYTSVCAEDVKAHRRHCSAADGIVDGLELRIPAAKHAFAPLHIQDQKQQGPKERGKSSWAILQVAEDALSRPMQKWTQSIVAMLAGSAVDDNPSLLPRTNMGAIDPAGRPRQYYFLMDTKAGRSDRAMAVGLIIAEAAKCAFPLPLAPLSRQIASPPPPPTTTTATTPPNESSGINSMHWNQFERDRHCESLTNVTDDSEDESGERKRKPLEMQVQMQIQPPRNAFDALISRERQQQKQMKEAGKQEALAAEQRHLQEERRKLCQTAILAVDTSQSVPVEIGIAHMWMHPAYRRLGLMQQGLDYIRATWDYVRVIGVEVVSFSTLRVDGYCFASRYVADRQGTSVHIYQSP